MHVKLGVFAAVALVGLIEKFVIVFYQVPYLIIDKAVKNDRGSAFKKLFVSDELHIVVSCKDECALLLIEGKPSYFDCAARFQIVDHFREYDISFWKYKG
jgi:hypothetical protein